MAFPTTTQGWVAYVRNWIGADDYSDSQVGQFIDLAHTRLNTDLMSYPMEKVARHLVTAAEVTAKAIDLHAVLPDFGKIRLVELPGLGALDVAAGNEFADKASQFTNGCQPRGIYNIDAGKLKIWPWLAENTIVDIYYYEMVPALGSTRNSNTFSTKHPDLLLYASVLEAAPYMVEDERIPVWESKYAIGVTTANNAAAKIKMGSTPLRRDFKTLNYGTSRLGVTIGVPVVPVPAVPVNTTPPLLSRTSADTDDGIGCGTGTWTSESEILFYEYQWMRNGVDIVGSTSNIYGTSPTDDGTIITCKVRATNDDGTSEYVLTSNSCTVSVLVVSGSPSFFPSSYFPAGYFSTRYFP